MKKSNNNTWKRIAAGALSLALVAGALPANVGGLLTGGKVLVARAEESSYTFTATGNRISNYTCNSSDNKVSLSADFIYKIENGSGPSVYRVNSTGSKVVINSTGTIKSVTAVVNSQVDMGLNASGGTKSQNDHTYTISDVNASSLTLTGASSYGTGITSITVTYAEKVSLTAAEVEAVTTTYTGSALTPTIKIGDTTLTNGTDYTYEVYDTATPSNTDESIGDPTNAGTYYVKVTGKGGYTGTKIVQWNVSQATLTLDNLVAGGERVNGVPSQLTYTGEEQAVKLYYKKNDNTYVPLTAGTDYDVTPYEGAFYLYDDGQRLIASNATNVGNYSAVIVPKGNYKDDSTSDIYAFWSIAKADLKAGTDYTAPTGSDELKYKAAEIPLLEDGYTGSVNDDSHTNQPVGTMEYGIAGTKEATNIIKNNETQDLNVEEVKVGDIYSPVGNKGINIPKSAYSKYILDDKEYESVASWTYLKYNGSRYYMTARYEDPGLKDGCDAVRVKEIRSDAIVFESYNSALETIDWKTTVPTAKDVGEYKVYYRVKGDANHNDTAPAYVTSKIDYATVPLTLASTLGDVKVVEVDGDTETEITASNGVYTLKSTKSYKIYTQKTVSTDEVETYKLTKGYDENEGDAFEYVYSFKIKTVPVFETYNLSHMSNWTGKVSSTDPTKLYIADGEVTPNTGKLAATLKANSTYYYGDVINESSIEIDEAYKDLIKVKNVYFSDSSGAAVDINNAKYGTYSLRAEIVVDNNANEKFDDDGVDLSYTVYKDVEYKARPMAENAYFLETPDGKLPLTVANGTVTVPEKYYVYSGMIDGNPDDKLVVTEKREALSVMFSRCEEKQTFTYNGTEQKPTIIVKNGGNKADVVASIPATDTAAAVAKDYIDGVKAETNAGDYSYTLTAETGTTEAPANYSGAVTVKWTIAQADIQQYITIAPKNNVDTDEIVGNDAIVYDGAVLDGTDFEVKTNEAYAALTDSEADKATKALVDEFVAGLTAVPATETTPAVAAKTTVNVAPAKVETIDEAEYEYTGADGATINEENYRDFIGMVVNGNLNLTAIKPTDGYLNFTAGENTSRLDTKYSGEQTLRGETYNLAFSNNSLSFNEIGCAANAGYLLIIDDISVVDTQDYGVGYSISFKGVPASTTSLADSNIKDASVDGEVKKANVTVKNSNFKDVEFKQTLTNDGKIDTTVEDKSIPVTIAKRAATITPDEDNRITYRDLSAPTLNYEYEKAATEEALLRGVIAADEGLFDSTRDGYVAPIGVKEFNIGELNDAKSYNYEIVDSEVFANYKLSLPTENVPTFTVDPLNLNNIKDLSIVLNGKTDDWTQDGNSGYYTYDGSSKSVEVTKVAKANTSETAQTQTVELLASETTGVTDPYIKDGFTLKFSYRSSENPNVIGSISSSTDSVKIIVPADKIATKITVDGYYYDFLQRQYIAFSDLTNFTTEFEGNYTGTVSMKDVINYNDLTSYHDGMIYFSKITVTYKDVDEYALTANTDYTVGGMTKSATVGEKTVQVKGKGNYTGVAKATWVMKPVDNVEGLVKFKTNATWSEAYQYYDWHYTGEPISCGAEFTDPDSNYAQDAEVTVKYTRFNNITGEYEEVDEAVHQGKYKVNVKVECDGYSPVEFNYDINIAPKEIKLEDTPFTINYGEDYSDHTDELLALFVENGLLQSDADLIKQMLEDGTLIWYYDEGWLYPTWSDDVYEAAFEEAVKEGKDPVEDWTVIESMIHKLYGDAVYQVANAHDNDIILVNPIIKPKSIKSDDVTVEFENGNTVVLDENGFVSESSIIVKDTGILNDDGEPTVLLAGTDYELNIESTATEGEYIVEIVGKGNYRAIRKVTFTAITFKPTAETTVEDAANSKLRLTVNAGTEDSSLVAKTGVIFYRGTNCPAELTIESAAANNDIYDFSAEGTAFTGTVKDSKGGVHYVGYIVLTNGTVKYTDVISTTINDEILNANKPTANTTIEDAANSKLRLTVNTETVDSSLVAKTGVIFYRGTNCPAELTIESAAANNDIYDFSAEGTAFTGTVKDSKGGVHYVGYTVLTNGTVKYTDVISTTINDEIWNAVELTANTTVEDAANSKLRLMVNAETEDSSLVTKTGVIFYRGTNCPEELTIESAAANNDIYDFSLEGTSFTGTVKDSKGGVHYVGYTVLVNGTVKYTDSISTKISDFVN